jgi:AcrR family transcriptional regulator
VDRESRRAEIVTAYLRLVAREGVEHATSRAVAAELGVASGALWHYFADYDEVLSAAFRRIFDQTNARIDAGTDGRRGLSAVAAMLTEILPLSAVTHDEALVVVSFWGRVASRPDLAAFQSQAEQVWRERLLTHLEQARAGGHLLPGAPLDLLADTLLVLCIGQQVEHVLRTDVARPARQWEVVGGCLAPWLTPTGRTEGGLPVPPGPAARTADG